MTRPVPTIAMLGVLIAAISPPAQGQQPLGTEITYQGRLTEAGQPANGAFDLDFSLWDAETGGNQVGATVTLNSEQVTNGLFTVQLDFGAAAFDNSERWLEIAVEGATLSPRHPVTRTPYAIQTRGIFVDNAGQVGIGTTEPVGDLHVDENSDNPASIVIDSGVTFADRSFIELRDRGTAFWAMGKDFNNTFYVDGVNGRALTINSGNNVGLGTPFPQAKLHIVGTPGADGIRFPDDTVQTRAFRSSTRTVVFDFGPIGPGQEAIASGTLQGAVFGDLLIAIAQGDVPAGLIVHGPHVPANDTFRFLVHNLSGQTVDPPPFAFTMMSIRP